MMAQPTQPSTGNWLKASGLQEIARTLGLAVHPAKLGLALAGILATLAYGSVLDWVFTRNGGIAANAVTQFIVARELHQPYTEGTGELGVFKVWREHERNCLLGFLGSPVISVTPATALTEFVEAHAIRAHRPWYTNLADMGRGVWWMARIHPFYFLVFSVGTLLIWSLAGGAICRIAAVQFARDEKITAKEAIEYVGKRLIGGFMLAPVIPILFIVLVSILLILGGVVLRIPVLGDLFSLLFPFALFGGFAIAILMVGLIVGGGLFWPAVATEGSDAFDAFSRSLAYPFSRPWKALCYFLTAGVYLVVCWLLVSLIVHWALLITRSVVSWGTAPFGWWRGEANVSKLERLWPLGGTSGLHQWPDWSQLGFFEDISALMIGVCVVLAIGITWAFLFSFCFSADTVIYFLLRRDVDGNDTSDIHLDQPASGPGGKPHSTEAATSTPAPSGA